MKKFLKKLWRFAVNNYFISIFLAAIAFVGVVSIYKLFFVQPTFVYAKVKVGQGLWWAATQKPSLWFVRNIKKGDVQTDLVGEPTAEILSVRYYPTYISNQYDVYLTMKLKVSGNKKTGKYNFNRSTIGVGAPIDLEFPSSQFSGTVTEFSEKPILDKYVKKTVYLLKSLAYTWEYDGIKIGDKFFDGEANAVEIVDKSAIAHPSTVTPSRYFLNEAFSQDRSDIVVKLELEGKFVDGKFVFGEEQVVSLGKTVYLSTDNFTFTDYLVSKVE